MYPKILLIEQTGELRELLNEIRSFATFNFISTTEPSLALQLCDHLSPNMIFVDFELPELHGYEFSQQVNGSFERPHIPLIAVIHPAHIIEHRKSLYTVDNYLFKPVNIDQLRQNIQTYLLDQPTYV
ncbi:response regulator [Roseofilum sp. BLCC_M154]|uniref:Response regulator n=1 Tax=Roseofilum acuticapitatum BLCC-M154 TaxID=3022444 RepID=A0ABT7ARJ1_9CYAN|nr:response regulator [Roseofilum acuticapitatum]MDJ1169039.1 response regulator [Roseofilum acuticapitatum BLCC-M154]